MLLTINDNDDKDNSSACYLQLVYLSAGTEIGIQRRYQLVLHPLHFDRSVSQL